MNCRAGPFLGMFVSIRTDGDDGAVDAAFAAIERVHRLMSPQDPDSDLSRINRRAQRRPVEVHPWTYAVLRSAQAMSRASAGIFDITEGRYGARHEDVELIEGRRGRLRSRARLDLGGIAKGFPGDRGVQALTRVIAICGPRRALLARFRAEAFLVDDRGTLYAARP